MPAQGKMHRRGDRGGRGGPLALPGQGVPRRGGGLFGAPCALFGSGAYSGTIIQGGSVVQPVNGVLAITGAATVAVDAATGACAVMCDTLVLDGASASLAPATRCKGLVVFARTAIRLLNGAKIHINGLGRAGSYEDINGYTLTPPELRPPLLYSAHSRYTAPEAGAAGAPRRLATNTKGINGLAATLPLQCGGGGSAASFTAAWYGGAGGVGGTCCGGAGGGTPGGDGNTGVPGCDASAYGGPGGNAGFCTNPMLSCQGGAGDPPGTSCYSATPVGCGGGRLMLFSPSVSIASGCVVSADGKDQASGGNTYGSGGGGGGGGSVCIVTRRGRYANLGTVRAIGGLGGPGYGDGVDRPWAYGGDGGLGSVNIFSI